MNKQTYPPNGDLPVKSRLGKYAGSALLASALALPINAMATVEPVSDYILDNKESAKRAAEIMYLFRYAFNEKIYGYDNPESQEAAIGEDAMMEAISKVGATGYTNRGFGDRWHIMQRNGTSECVVFHKGTDPHYPLQAVDDVASQLFFRPKELFMLDPSEDFDGVKVNKQFWLSFKGGLSDYMGGYLDDSILEDAINWFGGLLDDVGLIDYDEIDLGKLDDAYYGPLYDKMNHHRTSHNGNPATCSVWDIAGFSLGASIAGVHAAHALTQGYKIRDVHMAASPRTFVDTGSCGVLQSKLAANDGKLVRYTSYDSDYANDDWKNVDAVSMIPLGFHHCGDYHVKAIANNYLRNDSDDSPANSGVTDNLAANKPDGNLLNISDWNIVLTWVTSLSEDESWHLTELYQDIIQRSWENSHNDVIVTDNTTVQSDPDPDDTYINNIILLLL